MLKEILLIKNILLQISLKIEIILREKKDFITHQYKIYFFLLRFGLTNAINEYLRLKIHVVCVGNF